jgi:CheY-like chemotaxis protein
MDGFDLARRIRAREQEDRLSRTPILAITASALEDQVSRTRDVGMDGLVTKPVGIEQLRATLYIWLKEARTERVP